MKPLQWPKDHSPRPSAIRPATALLLLALWLATAPAQAHHIKGLPHFGYKDQGWYPQIPSKETIRRVPGHLIIATTVPGEPKAGNQVNIHLYIKDLRSNTPLATPVSYRITRKKLFFFTELIRPHAELKPVLELYPIATRFPRGGTYTLTIQLPNGAQATIPIEVAP